MTSPLRAHDKLILALLTLFLLLSISDIYQQYRADDGWTVADWLINYRQGFVRRGLPGTLFTDLSTLTGSKPGLFVFCTQAILYLAFVILLFLLIKDRHIPFWYWLLLLSPATLLFSVYDDGPVGKKEILYLVLLAGYVFASKRALSRNKSAPLAWAALSLLATLSHELFFFYTPYFFWASIILKKEHPALPKQAIAIFLASLLAISLIYVQGQKIDGSGTCRQLVGLGMNSNICNGILSYPFSDFKSAYANTLRVASEYRYYSSYLTAAFITLFPLLFVGMRQGSIKKFAVALSISLVLSMPLFISAIDWGRWINIHAMAVLIVSTLFLPHTDSSTLAPISQQEGGPGSNSWTHGARRIAALFIIVGYALSWSMPHCCEKHLGHGIFSLG